MLDRATRATIVFSDRAASDFMAARTSFSSLLIRLLPAARVRYFLNSSSKHSSSGVTTSGRNKFRTGFVLTPAGYEV